MLITLFYNRNCIILTLFLMGLISPNTHALTGQDVASAANKRTEHFVVYTGRYVSIPYPMGDVPKNTGVCTDVIIRSYRHVGIDLQQLVHEDLKANFDAYPSKRIWGLTRPDTNIDHRRVPNLQVFFERNGKSLPITTNPDDYLPGDIVSWMLPGNMPHIGIVSDVKDSSSGVPLVVHNIGFGPKRNNALFDYPITGHYRYLPERDLPEHESPQQTTAD